MHISLVSTITKEKIINYGEVKSRKEKVMKKMSSSKHLLTWLKRNPVKKTYVGE